MNPYWMGAITGVAASFVGLLGAVVVAYANHRLERGRERQRWEREQRQDALIRRVEDVRVWSVASARLEALANVLAFELAGLDRPIIFAAFARFIEPIYRDLALLPLEHHTAVMNGLFEYIKADFAEEGRVSLGEPIGKSLLAASVALDQAIKERDAALKSK